MDGWMEGGREGGDDAGSRCAVTLKHRLLGEHNGDVKQIQVEFVICAA